MTDLVRTANKIRQKIEDTPGITASTIAQELGVSKGRVSQVVAVMRQSDEVMQKRNGREVELHMTSTATRRKIIRERWA